MYLMVHALNWLEITPGAPRRLTDTWEQWPGRCERCHQYEFALRDRYYGLVRQMDDSCGMFVLPSGMSGDPPLIELARERLGGRCVVCELGGDREANCRALGETFRQGLDADRARAVAVRGPSLTEGEIGAWERSKAWAVDLHRKLEANGFTYDPATVEFIAFGEDWCGCAATYPIHMGRALGLTNPIQRRFDLINPDCSPLLLGSTAIAQDVEVVRNLRLFIYRSAEGRLLAQYWEGCHALYDPPRAVELNMPADSVRLVGTDGRPRGDWTGGRIVLSAGCGGHTPLRSDLDEARPSLSEDLFRRALVAARGVAASADGQERG